MKLKIVVNIHVRTKFFNKYEEDAEKSFFFALQPWIFPNYVQTGGQSEHILISENLLKLKKKNCAQNNESVKHSVFYRALDSLGLVDHDV